MCIGLRLMDLIRSQEMKRGLLIIHKARGMVGLQLTKMSPSTDTTTRNLKYQRVNPNYIDLCFR